MSRPDPGTYYVYSRVLSTKGEKLAITFNGKGNLATLTPWSGAANQQWKISNYDSNTQAFAPITDTSLQCGWGEGVIVLPAGSYVWTVKNTDSGVTIQDGGKTQNWNATNATSGDKISIAPDKSTDRFRWIFESVMENPR